MAAYVGITSLRNRRQYHLAFLAIPSSKRSVGVYKEADSRLGGKATLEMRGGLDDKDGDESAVFLGVTELVKCVEKIIPSFVWLESFKEITDFRRKILGPSGGAGIDIVSRLSERKGCLSGRRFPAGDGGGVSALVEDGTQVVGDIEQNARGTVWQFSRENDFVNFLSRLRISINDVGPWAWVDEVFDHGIEISDMVLCPFEGHPGATEDVCHGEKPDPTKEPEFQKVIRHFVTTPHKPHEPLKKQRNGKPSLRHVSNEEGAEEPSDNLPKANR